MADVAFDAVKLVVNFIREEARLQGRAGDDVRFIMDEMESMNNLLHQLVSTTKPNNHDTARGGGGGDYSHLRTWMKQLLELAFDSRNSVELYIQSGGGDRHCYWLPWAMVARHRVVSRIRELKERAREISERQMRYGGGLLPAQRQVGDKAEDSAVSVSNSNQRQRRTYAGSSSDVRRAILDREFVDNSSVDEALRRLKILSSNSDDDGSGGDESSDNDHDSDGEQPLQQSDTGGKKQQSDAGDKQQQQPTLPDAGDKQQQQPTQSDTGNKKEQQLTLPDTSGYKQQQLTQSDTGDKKQQSDTGVKQQQQSDGSDQQQQQPLSDTSDKEQQSDAGVKQQQSDGSDKQQQQPMLSDTGVKQQQSDAGDKQQEPTPSDTSDKRQQSDAGVKQLDSSDKKKKKKKKKQDIRVVAILVQDGMDEVAVGEAVLNRYNELSYKLSKPWRSDRALHVSVRRPPILPEIIVHIANQAKKPQSQMGRSPSPYQYSRNSQAVPAAGDDDEFKEDKKAEEFIKTYCSSGQALLLVLSGLSCPKILDGLKNFLCGLFKGDKPRKFAIALCTNDSVAAKDYSSKRQSLIKYSLVDIYLQRAVALLPGSYHPDHMSPTVREILEKCSPDEVCMKMILYALYYNPDMKKKEMEHLNKSLDGTGHQEKENRIISFCYQTLPNDYKNCLWYSAVFSRGISTPGGIRRATLLRRWIAQGLIKEEAEANHCFHAMVEQKLIRSHQVSGMGKVKSCAVHTLVDDLIKRDSPTVEDLLLNNQLPIENLDLLYSIRNGMQLHPASSSITSFLNSMSSNSMSLLTVLDLEGRNDLKTKDLKTICKIRKLKYLSLRNTDVTHLPKRIGQLEDLETLDIRGTKVLVFNTVLPKLKHLLAGRIIDCQDQDTDIIKSKESFSTVCMPRAVDTMENLEILSRVKVTNSAKELINVGDKLEHLKKLGVVLSGKKASLKELFLQIEKLNQCLRSLSIRMEPPGNWDVADVILLRPPKLLESLHICSIRRGLPPRIKELHHLAKITLRDTFLKQDDLRVLGMLPELRCLRLFYHSFGEGTITFGNSSRYWMFLGFEESFKNLTDISIEDDTITRVTIHRLTKLEKMTWSFSYMESLSGVQNLQSLIHLELNGGSYNPEGLQKLQRDIARNQNRKGIDVKIDPPQRGEESRVVGPAP